MPNFRFVTRLLRRKINYASSKLVKFLPNLSILRKRAQKLPFFFQFLIRLKFAILIHFWFTKFQSDVFMFMYSIFDIFFY